MKSPSQMFQITMHSKRLLLLLVMIGWSLPVHAARPVSPAELSQASPGDVLRVTRSPGGAPNGVRAYRILYRSTALSGQPLLVSAAMFYSDGDFGTGPRPILAWAHPTSGVTRDCGPSERTDVFNKIPGIIELLRSGFAVIATDYAGFASVEPHPYLVGESHARTVLDSVRAVRQFSAFKASHRFAVWGHSQGGHAALFTGELHPEFAPELELVAVAAAAPATRLADLFRSDIGTVWGNALTAMALHSWSHVYGIPIETVVDASARPAYRRLARDCLLSLSDVLDILRDEKPLEGRFLTRDPTSVPQWRRVMDMNSAGRLAIKAPVLIAQGRKDAIVPHGITRRFAEEACARGSRVQFIDLPDTDHMYAAEHSARDTVAWIKQRFAGQRLTNTC